MVTMFEIAMKPALQSVGVTPQPTWHATKRHIAGQANAQLRRPDLKPATVAKWHRLGYMTQPMAHKS